MPDIYIFLTLLSRCQNFFLVVFSFFFKEKIKIRLASTSVEKFEILK